MCGRVVSNAAKRVNHISVCRSDGRLCSRLLDVETWASQDSAFDVVACLNLLDRCDRPLDILEDMKHVLKPDGIVLLAMVLPFKPYVEVGE